jgi:hypothetical protein
MKTYDQNSCPGILECKPVWNDQNRTTPQSILQLPAHRVKRHAGWIPMMVIFISLFDWVMGAPDS